MNARVAVYWSTTAVTAFVMATGGLSYVSGRLLGGRRGARAGLPRVLRAATDGRTAPAPADSPAAAARAS